MYLFNSVNTVTQVCMFLTIGIVAKTISVKHLKLLPAVYEHSFTYPYISLYFICSSLGGYEVVSHRGLICIFLMTYKVEHLFMCRLPF